MKNALPPLVVFLLSAALYRWTMMPGLGLSETAEFQTLPAVLGIAQPAGHPLYMLVGKAFSLWPEGTIAWRMNLLSVLSAAGASAALMVLGRLLGSGWIAAGAAALAFALHLPLWHAAGHANPYTLHVALGLLSLILALAWQKDRRLGFLWAAALVAGLGVSNHLAAFALVPALLLWVGSQHKALSPKASAGALGAWLLGLSIYLYLPLRAMQGALITDARPVPGWPLLSYGIRALDGPALRPEGMRTFFSRLYDLPGLYADWLSPWGAFLLAGLGIAGGLALVAKDRNVAAFIGLALLGSLYAACTAQGPHLSRHFLVSTALLCALGAVGAQVLAGGLAHFSKKRKRGTTPVLVALLIVPLGLLPIHWPRADQRHDRRGIDYQHRVFALLKPGAAVVADHGDAAPLRYGRYVKRSRSDLSIVVGDSERAIARYLPHRPVYVIGTSRLSHRYRLKLVRALPPYGQPLYEVLKK